MLLESSQEIADRIKTNVLVDYVMNIRVKVNLAKRKDIKSFMLRNDHQTILTVQDKEDHKSRDIIKYTLGDFD